MLKRSVFSSVLLPVFTVQVFTTFTKDLGWETWTLCVIAFELSTEGFCCVLLKKETK